MPGFTAISTEPGRADLFFLEGADAMAHASSTGSGWGGSTQEVGWDHLGGAFASAPVVVDATPKVLEFPTHGFDVVNSVGPSVVTPPASAPPAVIVSSAAVLSSHALESPHAAGAVVANGAVSDLADTTRSSDQLDVFAIGSDYALYHQVLPGGAVQSPTAWHSLGGIFTSAPTVATAFGPSRIDVFGIGLDRAMYHRTWNGLLWSHEWERIGGTFSSTASAVATPGQLDLFVRGADFQLRHRAYDGSGWLNDWQALGGSLASAPTAVSSGPGRLDVLAVSDTGTLIHIWWDGMIWNAPELVGSAGVDKLYVGVPSVVSTEPGRMDVLVPTADGELHHYWFTQSAWNGPATLALTEPVDDCTLITTSPGTLHGFAAAGAGRILESTFDGTTWSTWDQTGMHLSLPCRYEFSVDLVDADTARSANTDTDTAQSTLAVGKSAANTRTQFNAAVGGTHPHQWQTNLLRFGPVVVELADSVAFNYQIINKADPDPTLVGKALDEAGKKLVDYAISAVSSAFAAGFEAVTSIAVGTLLGVPVAGPILGIVSDWLMKELSSIVFADCDGPIAVEQAVLLGRELHMKTAAGPYRTTTRHAGTDSAFGCGSNSVYDVTWSVTRV